MVSSECPERVLFKRSSRAEPLAYCQSGHFGGKLRERRLYDAEAGCPRGTARQQGFDSDQKLESKPEQRWAGQSELPGLQAPLTHRETSPQGVKIHLYSPQMWEPRVLPSC